VAGSGTGDRRHHRPHPRAAFISTGDLTADDGDTDKHNADFSPEVFTGSSTTTFDIQWTETESGEAFSIDMEPTSKFVFDDTFRPAAKVSRQSMSAFMYRLADGPGVGA
jgi:hypothetical protein